MSIFTIQNWHFLTLPLISPQQMMIERQIIHHMNALLGGFKILGEQHSSYFRGCHPTSSLKSIFFTRKVAWSSLIELRSWAWDILSLTSRAKKWSIICLRSLSDSLSNPLFTKKVEWKPLIKLHSWAWHILIPTSGAKKWGIICLCTSSGSHSNQLQSKKWK